jgi:hypothetical protein
MRISDATKIVGNQLRVVNLVRSGVQEESGIDFLRSLRKEINRSFNTPERTSGTVATEVVVTNTETYNVTKLLNGRLEITTVEHST